MVYPNLINASYLDRLNIVLEYDNNESRVIDISQFCKSSFFKELEDNNYLKKFKIENNTLVWPNEQDIAPETLYLESIKIK